MYCDTFFHCSSCCKCSSLISPQKELVSVPSNNAVWGGRRIDWKGHSSFALGNTVGRVVTVCDSSVAPKGTDVKFEAPVLLCVACLIPSNSSFMTAAYLSREKRSAFYAVLLLDWVCLHGGVWLSIFQVLLETIVSLGILAGRLCCSWGWLAFFANLCAVSVHWPVPENIEFPCVR